MKKLYAVVDEKGEIQPGGCRSNSGVYQTRGGATQNLPTRGFWKDNIYVRERVPGFRVVELKWEAVELPSTVKIEIPSAALPGFKVYLEKLGGKVL